VHRLHVPIGDGASRLREPFGRVLERLVPEAVTDVSYAWPGGERQRGRVSLAPLKDRNGAAIGVLGLLTAEPSGSP
jgi:hypothetical protein